MESHWNSLCTLVALAKRWLLATINNISYLPVLSSTKACVQLARVAHFSLLPLEVLVLLLVPLGQMAQSVRPKSASYTAATSLIFLFLAMLAISADFASARGVVPGPTVQEGLLVKPNWIFNREFFFKRDQARNGQDLVDMRANRLAKFGISGEAGYWKVERRAPPGTKHNWKLPLQDGMDVLVLDVPEQGERKDLIVSYEIPVTRGRYHPSAIMFAPEGSIYVARSKQELVGAAASARKKIGTFAVDLPTLPPIVDRAFTL